MYTFKDTISNNDIITNKASEDIIFNDKDLSQEIEGFRVLTAEGRNNFDKSVVTADLDGADGSAFCREKVESKTIIVNYRIMLSKKDLINDVKDRLHNILLYKRGASKLIFADDLNWYYNAICSSLTFEVKSPTLVTGQVVFICNDPYRYSVEIKTFDDGDGNGMIINTLYPDSRNILVIDGRMYDRFYSNERDVNGLDIYPRLELGVLDINNHNFSENLKVSIIYPYKTQNGVDFQQIILPITEMAQSPIVVDRNEGLLYENQEAIENSSLIADETIQALQEQRKQLWGFPYMPPNSDLLEGNSFIELKFSGITAECKAFIKVTYRDKKI